MLASCDKTGRKGRGIIRKNSPIGSSLQQSRQVEGERPMSKYCDGRVILKKGTLPENKLTVTRGKSEEEGINQECAVNRHKLLYIK